MKRTLVTLAVLALISGAAAQQSTPAVQQIEAQILVGSHAQDTLRTLADGFGGRLTGTPSYQRAAQWAAEQFRSYGITDVKLEPFTIEHGWERVSANGRMLAPLQHRLAIESLGWSPSTPAGGVQGEVVALGPEGLDRVRQDAARYNGKIVMLAFPPEFWKAFRENLPKVLDDLPLLKEAGAQAVVYSGRTAGEVLSATSGHWGTSIQPLPFAQIGMEDAELIGRLLEKGPVQVEINLQNRITGPVQVNNVVAEIPGSAATGEWVIVGAHLDSWDFATGAQDNGSGSAEVLEAARAIASLKTPPRHTIRFALWGGEEQGLLGSAAYVEAHAAEMPQCWAVLNTDNGAGDPEGWKYEGRDEVKEALEPLSKTLLASLGAEQLSDKFTYDTDHGPFVVAGVPGLDLLVDMTHYGEIHHKASDTYDKVDPMLLKNGAAVVAVTAYTIAERGQPLAPHASRDQVMKILDQSGWLGFLKYVGVWK